MRRMHGLFSAVVLLACLGTARADDKCRQILDRAIQAHGAAKLEKLPARSWKSKGTWHTAGMDILIIGETHQVGQDKLRIEKSCDIAGTHLRTVYVLDGTLGWAVFGEDTAAMDGEGLTEIKEYAHLQWAHFLYPLRDKAYRLSPVADIAVEGRPAVGFKVSRDGYRDFTLYFDAETYLQVKRVSQARLVDNSNLEEEEVFFSNYKEVNGMKLPMTCRTKWAGGDSMETENLEFRAVLKLDDKLFQKPEK